MPSLVIALNRYSILKWLVVVQCHVEFPVPGNNGVVFHSLQKPRMHRCLHRIWQSFVICKAIWLVLHLHNFHWILDRCYTSQWDIQQWTSTQSKLRKWNISHIAHGILFIFIRCLKTRTEKEGEPGNLSMVRKLIEQSVCCRLGIIIAFFVSH